MKTLRRCACVGLLALTAAATGTAQRHRDPFTQPEIDQIRDASAGEQMRNDPKTKDRAQQTHDKLDDFLLIYDELNDNIDTYVDRKNDIRKPLKRIIDADTEFQAKLRALKDAADVPAEEVKQYEFALTNTLDTIDSSADDHRKLLAEQEEAAKHRKKSDTKQAGGRPE